jgi:hypothetical protein
MNYGNKGLVLDEHSCNHEYRIRCPSSTRSGEILVPDQCCAGMLVLNQCSAGMLVPDQCCAGTRIGGALVLK